MSEKRTSKNTQNTTRGTPPRKQARKRVRKRRGRYLLHYILAGMFAVALGVILSLTVFFKIQAVVVVGNTHYQEAALIGSSEIQLGENLFRINSQVGEQEILATYPYVEEVRIGRRFPVTAVITIKEAVPMGSFLQPGGGYVLVSEKGRVLQVGQGEPPNGYLKVSGVEVTGVSPCDTLPEDVNESMTMFRYLDKAVKETSFTGITAIDLSNPYNILLIYEDRLRIELGNEGELVDKLDFVQYAIREEIESGFEGVVDVTIAGQVRIRKMEIHPEGYHPMTEPVPPVVPEENGEENKANTLPEEEKLP